MSRARDDDSQSDSSELPEEQVSARPSIASKIRNISYGDLAQAQAEMPSSKRTTINQHSSHTAAPLPHAAPSEKLQTLRDRLAELKQSKKRKEKRKAQGEDQSSDDDENSHARSSKHAPREQTSKRAVTRKRTITDVVSNPTHVRDPRFSAASGFVDPTATARRYAFLSEYRDGEIQDLKDAMKKTKDPEEKARLRVAAGRMENRARVEKQREQEAQLVREHRREEREKVKHGKTPFFLKKGKVRDQVAEERFEGLGKKAQERLLKRRQQKVAQREKRSMPDVRRRERA